MNLLPIKAIATFVITLIIVGVFAIPTASNAAIGDYNSTDSESEGDIKISKEVKEIGEDDSYHDKIEVRSGALVEVWIEVKNTSSKYNANAIVTDELGANTVYEKNSLRVNGQTSQPGLTSGGLKLNIPQGGKSVIIYRMHVCGNSGYPMRAYAYAAGVGAATDAIIVTTETFGIGYFDQTYSCVAQFQNSGTSNTSFNNTGVLT